MATCSRCGLHVRNTGGWLRAHQYCHAFGMTSLARCALVGKARLFQPERVLLREGGGTAQPKRALVADGAMQALLLAVVLATQRLAKALVLAAVLATQRLAKALVLAVVLATQRLQSSAGSAYPRLSRRVQSSTPK